jgi:hypothetical protein
MVTLKNEDKSKKERRKDKGMEEKEKKVVIIR